MRKFNANDVAWATPRRGAVALALTVRCCNRCRARSRLDYTHHVFTSKIETVAVGHIIRKNKFDLEVIIYNI